MWIWNENVENKTEYKLQLTMEGTGDSFKPTQHKTPFSKSTYKSHTRTQHQHKILKRFFSNFECGVLSVTARGRPSRHPKRLWQRVCVDRPSPHLHTIIFSRSTTIKIFRDRIAQCINLNNRKKINRFFFSYKYAKAAFPV